MEDVLRGILKGPRELVLDFNLQIEHSIGFSEFLWALSSSKTIRRVDYHGILDLHLSIPQKEHLIEAFGQMKGLEELCFSYGVNISPKALASTVRKARSLRILNVGIGSRLHSDGRNFLRNTAPPTNSDMTILARALQFHPSLESFVWILRQGFDPSIAEALATCPKLRHVSLTECGNFSISVGIGALRASNSLRSLELRTSCNWQPIAELLEKSDISFGQAIRLTSLSLTHFPSRSNQNLTLDDVVAVANRIKSNKCLEKLAIRIKGDFTNEMSIVLADALKKNRGNLKSVSINAAIVKTSNRAIASSDQIFQAASYQAFCDALTDNHNLVLTIDIQPPMEKESPKSLAARSNVRILSKLNSLGRGKLRSDEATKLDWIHVFTKIEEDFLSDRAAENDATYGVTMALSCIYTLVRMSPIFLINQC